MTPPTSTPLELRHEFEVLLERVQQEADHVTARQGPIADTVRRACQGPLEAAAMVFVFASEIVRGFHALTAETRCGNPHAHFGMHLPDDAEAGRGQLAANRVIVALANGQQTTAAMLSAVYLNTEKDLRQRAEYLSWWPSVAWDIAQDPEFTLASPPAGGEPA